MKHPSLVLVEWDDASADSETWHDRAETADFDLAKCRSVGWLVSKSAARLVLVACMADDQCGRRTAIPAGSVTRMVELMEKP
jgi:hypothetical protein